MISNIDIEKLKRIFIEKGQAISQVVNSIINWANISGKPSVFPPDTHEHDDIYLNIANTTPFTPDADYEPATKKYVDDNAGGGFFNKLDATTAPTVNDDSGDGYEIGSLWIDITNDNVYQCADATLTAAVWKCLSSVITDDAPADGTTYGRNNGAWASIATSLESLSFSQSFSYIELMNNDSCLSNLTFTPTLGAP